jgi:predicted pyridoxine 5'-phosphate oxidase superfamily flavin-nucleotide-binding protein
MKEIIALLVTIAFVIADTWLLITKNIGTTPFIALLFFALILGFFIVKYNVIKKIKFGEFEIETAEEKVTKIEESKKSELSKKYPVAYKVVGISEIEFIPSRSELPKDLQIDWNSGKIEKVTEDKIEILLPDITWQTNQFSSNRVILRKEVGFKVRPFSFCGWTQEIEVITVEKDIVVAVIGFTKELSLNT